MKNDQERSSLLCGKVRFLGQNPKIVYQEFQIPPNLVVKSQAIDIVEVI
jgi:hypothetical protein